MERKSSVSDAELEILEVLWEAEKPLNAAEIRSLLERNKNWERTTVLTLIQRLVKKGMLRSYVIGRHGRDITLELLRPGFVRGLTLLGGEPFEPQNQGPIVDLLRQVKAQMPEKSIWAFSGYLFDRDILSGRLGDTREYLSYLDVLVDGPFIQAKKNLALRFRGSENSVSENMIEAVQKQPGFEEGGRLYFNSDAEYFTVEHDAPVLGEDTNPEGDQVAAVYGLEELPLKRLTVLEGEIDFEKLKTGKYILEGIMLGDDSTPRWEGSHFEIGDKVTLHSYKGTGETSAENEYIGRDFEVMAKVAINYYTNSCGRGYDYSYYLPAETYKEMIAVPGVMSYAFNVSDEGEAAMEEFLKNYTEKTEPIMNYSSKATRVAEFEGMQNMVVLVGGVLSLIIGIIAVLNFVNSMLTSIFTRKREFAMLQSVGMTAKQLRNMLMMEGLYYTAASGGLALLLGTVLSVVIVKAFAENMWFFTYRFTLLPLLVTIPLLLVIGLLLPLPVLSSVEKQSIVERLRETED